MQQPRRSAPGADDGTVEPNLPYDPVEWSRRLDEAREARARILAAREAEADRGDEQDDARRPGRPPQQAEPARQAQVPSARSHRTGRRLGLRVAAGFLFGMVLGAFVVVLFLPGGPEGDGLAMVPERIAEAARTPPGPPAGVSSTDATELPPPEAVESSAEGPGGADARVELAEPKSPAAPAEAAPTEPAAEAGRGSIAPVRSGTASSAGVAAAGAEDETEGAAAREPASRAADVAEDRGEDPPAIAPSDALVYVHAPLTVPSAELTDVVERLRTAGYGIGRVLRVGFGISETHVRYYFDEDAESAADIARDLSGYARDFTAYRPLPAPGTIEVWLQG